MSKKYKTKIEITSPATDKDEAMEIVGDYLSGNIMSGIEMKCTTKQVRFYDHSASKIAAVVLIISIGFLLNGRTTPQARLNIGTCQMAAVQPPLKTSNATSNESKFRKDWEEKQTRKALDFIKK